MMIKSTFGIIAFLFFLEAFANPGNPIYEDQPYPSEQFKYFVKRITRGGTFQGITVDAPQNFQQTFLKRIFRNSWVGLKNKEQKKLTDLGVDLYFDWYKELKPIRILLPNANWISDISPAYEQSLKDDLRCQTQRCLPLIELSSKEWSTWTTPERQAFSVSYLMDLKQFNKRSILEYLADEYSTKAQDLSSKVSIKLLDTKDFEENVKKMGWNGPIYFRGITGPDPDKKGHYWILLHSQFLKEKTEFSYPIYQALEHVLIMAHEMSHVGQDTEATTYGHDLRIWSAEGALLIEGMAETLSQRAIIKAAQVSSAINPLALFTREQAVEVVFREGNNTTGALFPYTVGLPFVTSMYDLKKSDSEQRSLNLKIYSAILNKPPLQELLFSEF